MTIVISDTHLGKYNRETDIFLRDLIKDFDRVIINGDFFDSWLVTFEEFVKSEYNELFDMLREKETIYIFGNHDQKESVDSMLLKEFADYEGYQYQTKIGKEVYHFEHGHKFIKKMDNKFYILWGKFLDLIPKPFRALFYKLSVLGYKITPKKISENSIGFKRNEFIKRTKPSDIYYVVGDTHVPVIDMENKYINTGCIIENLVSYLVIDDIGRPKLVRKIRGQPLH